MVCLSTSFSMLRNIQFFFSIKRDIEKRLNTVQNLFTYEISNDSFFIFACNHIVKYMSKTLNYSSAGFTNFQLSLTQNLFPDSLRRDWPPLLSIKGRQGNISFLFPLLSSFQKLSHVTHLEREHFFSKIC